MKRAILTAAALATLTAGCAGETAGEAPPPRSPATAELPPPSNQRDQCGAKAAQAFVGRPRSEIPVPVLPHLQRVACTTCPVTMDFNPVRLNFLFDAETGIIREVKCG